MNPNERALLDFIAGKGELSGRKMSERTTLPYSTVMSLLNALAEKGFVVLRKEETQYVSLTTEGKRFASEGLPERRLLHAIGLNRCMPLAEALTKAGLAEAEKPIALKWAKEKGLADVKAGELHCVRVEESEAELALEVLARGEASKDKLADAALKELLQRRLVSLRGEKEFFAEITHVGKKALLEEREVIGQLTPEMLRTAAWKNKHFKEYDLTTAVAPILKGRKHPYGSFFRRVKEKLVGMGFREVHGPLVEMEFWNMDALFMAQDHPAREIHDVFHLDDPAKGELEHHSLVQDVKQAHEKGLAGSKGWRYSWSDEVAARLIARSHDTGISARELFKSKKYPDKVFFVARVFRPDTIDWKHFIEFNQLGGYVAGEGMSFRELLGYLRTFAVEVFNAEDVRFAPSYFPFTEPSVELHAKIPKRGWTEMGGAGMFRPEMLKALKVDVPVMAWGLGLERFAMFSVGVNDIRELYSHDLKFLRG